MAMKLQLTSREGTASFDVQRILTSQELGFLTQVLGNLLEGRPFLPVCIGDNEQHRIKFGAISNNIMAIKLVREALGCGLKEAKDIVENTMDCPWMDRVPAEVLAEKLRANGILEFSIQHNTDGKSY